MWEGEYHVAPAPHGRHAAVDHQLARILGPVADQAGLTGAGPLNIGVADDYRVPDQAYLRDPALSAFHPSAAVVVEILSPGDETLAKLPFYFRQGVEEVLLVDVTERAVTWLARGDAELGEVAASTILGLDAEALRSSIPWPD